MTKRRLNPRAAAVYKKLYGKPHPDYVKHDIPILPVRFANRVTELADSFRALGASVEQLTASLQDVADSLRLQEQQRIARERIALEINPYTDYLTSLSMEQMRVTYLEAIRSRAFPRGVVADAENETQQRGSLEHQGTQSGRFGGLLAAADFGAIERDMLSVEFSPRRYHGFYPIPTDYRFSSTEDRVRETNHPSDNSNRHRPLHPGAQIRGFRRGP